MPDYNYDGVDDYTGVWKGFSRRVESEVKKLRPPPPPPNPRFDENYKAAARACAKSILAALESEGLPVVSEPPPVSFHGDGLQAAFSVHISVVKTWFEGFIFKKEISQTFDESAGVCRFTLDENLRPETLVFTEPFSHDAKARESWTRATRAVLSDPAFSTSPPRPKGP